MRRLVGLVALTLVVTLAACGPEADGGSGGGGNAGAGGRAEACLIGTWNVDVADVAQQAAALLRNGGGRGSAEGTITVIFGDTLTIRYADTLTIVSDSAGRAIGVRDSYQGDAVSTDYTAKDGKILGTLPGSAVTKTTAVIVGTQTQPATSGRIAGALDLAQGQTTYTCSGSTATIGTGTTITWKLTKA
jgi:hypothetical protein